MKENFIIFVFSQSFPEEKHESESCSAVSNFVTPWTIQSVKFSRPEYWSGSFSLLQGIFQTERSNQCLLHCRRILFREAEETKTNLFSSVQLLSHVWLFVTPWTVARQVSLFFTNSWRLLKLKSTKSEMPSNHLILCCSLLLPSIFPSVRGSTLIETAHPGQAP